jgi:hypothetical protein
MKKLIDIQDEIVIDLKVLAAKKNLSLKAFIQSELSLLVEKTKKKENSKNGLQNNSRTKRKNEPA